MCHVLVPLRNSMFGKWTQAWMQPWCSTDESSTGRCGVSFALTWGTLLNRYQALASPTFGSHRLLSPGRHLLEVAGTGPRTTAC